MLSSVEINDRPMQARVIRLPGVIAKVGLSKTTIYNRVKKEQFPLQAKLLDGSQTAGWFEDEIDAYNEKRRNARSKPPETTVVVGVAKKRADSPVVPSQWAPTRNNGTAKPDLAKKANQPFQEEGLMATGLQIMGCQVFLHRNTGKFLLDFGRMSSTLLAQFMSSQESIQSAQVNK